jgi:hypothetical protein
LTRLGVLSLILVTGALFWWLGRAAGLNGAELAVVGVVALLLFGRRLPELLR